MHTHHVLSRIDKQASGLTYAVPGICSALQAEGIPTTLHVASPRLQDYPFEVRSYARWPVLGNIALSPALFRALNHLHGSGLILHNHSLWTMPSLYAGLLASRGQLPVVFSPHGTLSPEAMKRSRWKKKLFWALGQRLALQNASCFHATSLKEAQDIRDLGFLQPIAVIPLGLPAPQLLATHTGPPYKVLFLARLHPHKGVEMLIEAWKNVGQRFPDWELQIAGPEDIPGYMGRLRKLAGQEHRISFSGAVFGVEKERLFSTCSLYVLPSRSENFGVTIAEALGAGIPVIVTKGSPWEEVETHACGWWIDYSRKELEMAMTEAMGLDASSLRDMGMRGREFVLTRYSWGRIGQEMKALYRWMLEKGPPPSCIID